MRLIQLNGKTMDQTTGPGQPPDAPERSTSELVVSKDRQHIGKYREGTVSSASVA
jgi:hypothetical protein